MKIAIWGLGVSGLGALKYLVQENKDQIIVINQGEVDSWCTDEVQAFISKDNCFAQSEVGKLKGEIDLILLSPGIDPRIDALKPFRNIKKICDVEYVSNLIKAPIIAVTGTNGKTSTVTMIGECLSLAGHSVFVGGNIGRSPFDALDTILNYDYFVFELSSFQLELMDTFHPFIAVILNITENHMERYHTFLEYVDAKVNITKNQIYSDYFIVDDRLNIKNSKAHVILIEEVCGLDFSSSNLVGSHMKKNLFVVEKVLELLNVKNRPELLQSFVSSFLGVKYRLQFKGAYQGVDFFNDAKSTNTAATITALSSFVHKNIILILGGKLRGESQDFFFPLQDVIKINQLNLKLYLFGESRDYLYLQLNHAFETFKFVDLASVIKNLDLNNIDIVLFSPGFPSFDQYKDYVERGSQFDALINELF